MSLLDFILGPRKTEEQKALEETLVLPVDLNEAHSFTAPPVASETANNKYPAKIPYGENTFAPSQGLKVAKINNQDKILVHFLQPPADKNPAEWYEDRSASKIELGKQERYQTQNITAESQSEGDVYQPWHHTPVSNRVTATQSPSNYRFIRPFDQNFQKNLNGLSGSAATLHRSYPIGGMAAVPQLRNTFRLEPTRWDIENFDLSSSSVPAAQPAVYVSPSAMNPQNQASWLGVR